MIHAYPNKWTPKIAHRFATKRVEKIKFLLEEISGVYEDVEQAVVNECDQIYQYGLDDLVKTLQWALEEGRTP